MPSIADIFVTVMPETAQIASGISRAFREVDPAAAEAGRRWGREIQRGLGDAKVELKADTTKAKAEIDAAAKDKKATVEVDADTAKANAQIDVVARDRKATIEVDADTLGSSMQRGISQSLPQVGAQLSQSLASSGASAGPQVGGSLSGAMPAVGTALTATLVGGAAAAAAGVAAALSGVIGLIPAGLGGGIGVIGTLVTGLDGVKDAWDAAGKAADSATKDQEEKSKAVASAQKSLRNAVLDEANAQKDVANARRDARQQLEDLNVQLRGGVSDEKQAILDAQAARRDLATGRFRDAIEYQQAQLRVEQADQRVLEAHERNVQLQQKSSEANAKGVEGADQVVAANQRLARAQDDVADAQRNLGDAQTKTSSSLDAFAQAMGKISPGAQAFITTLRGLKPAWDALKFSVQDSLFAGLGPEIQRLSTQYFPVLQSMMGSLAQTMNSAFKDLGTWLSRPDTMASIQQIVANIASSFQIWSQSLVPFSNAFLTITKVGSGFLPQLAQMIVNGATAFNRFIQEASRSGELQQWMQTGITALREFLRLFPVLGKMFLDLAPIGIPVLRELGSLLRALEPIIRVIGVDMAAHAQGVNMFFGAMGKLADKVVEFVRVTWPPFQSVLHTLESVFQRVFGTIANVIERVWRIVKPILGQFRGALGGLDPGGILGKLGNIFSSGGGGAPAASGGDGAQLPSLSSLRNPSLLPPAGSPLPRLSELRGNQPWLLHPPGASSALPGIPSAAPGSASSGFNWDAVAQAESSGNWSDRDSGHNGHYGGLQFAPDTWAAYGGLQFAQNPADASPEQQKIIADRVAFYGWQGKPPQGLGAWQAITTGKVPGITTSSTPPSGGMPGAAMPTMPGTSMPSMPGIPSAGASGYPGDAALLSRVPAGTYLQTQAADLTKGIGDCSSAVEDLINMLDGVSTAGRGLATSNADQWLKAHGFIPTDRPMPGSFQVGFNDHHMQATLPGGTNFNWGSDAAAANRGIGGTGAWDPAFTSHYYRPAGGMPDINGAVYPSAMMPTVAAPGGISPDGTYPLGTQNSPFYVMPAQSSGAEQLGQDFVSGIAEVFGFDGSLFKNPLDSGLFKGFKGLMSFLTGGGKGKGQGFPASYWQGAMGGDGASLPGMGAMPAMSGGDIFSGLGGMLTSIIPQPFGQIKPGGPAQAPDEFQPMLPGSGGNASLPSNFTPSGMKTAGPQIDNSRTYVLNGAPPPGTMDFLHGVDVPRARQGVQAIPGMSMP